MTQSRADGAADWSRVNDVFHRALVEPREARTAFLDQACAGDSALREEVASLLAAHEESPDFIQRPAAGASTLIEAAMESMSVAAGPLLAPGDLVGQYRIVHMLGRGGMGIVYLAEDTRLGRAVALKAVAPRFANDERRRERLRREARAAASLSHPGIATVYALETFGDELFVASEFVAGQTLRQELARGPLPPSRAIATALQLSRALACAHERGVVHRDLKPENVIRAENGDVKILDFGLARLGDPMGADGVLTEDGAVLGTPAYMSPEQARGQAVDFRSDIFSLGTLIYELATGINPFAGGSTASTVVKILEVDPPGLLSIRHQSAASELGRLEPIVHACLQKPVASRYRSTRDLVRALEDAHQAITSGRPVPTLVVSAALSGGTGAERWWRFHQAAATSAYAALLAPMWLAHMWTPGAGPLLLFIVALAAVIVAGTLRLHLWFAVSSYPAEWPAQHAVSRRLIRIADMTFVAALFAAAALLLTTHEEVAIVLIAAGVAIVLSALIIEPATTRAAFGDHTPRAS